MSTQKVNYASIPSYNQNSYSIEQLNNYISSLPTKQSRELHTKLSELLNPMTTLSQKIILIELLQVYINHKKYGWQESFDLKDKDSEEFTKQRQATLGFLQQTPAIQWNHMVELLWDITWSWRLQVADRNQWTFKTVWIIALSIALYYASAWTTGPLIATCLSSGAYSIIEQKIVQRQDINPIEVTKCIIVSMSILKIFSKFMTHNTITNLSPDINNEIITSLWARQWNSLIVKLQKLIKNKWWIIMTDLVEEVIENSIRNIPIAADW